MIIFLSILTALALCMAFFVGDGKPEARWQALGMVLVYLATLLAALIVWLAERGAL